MWLSTFFFVIKLKFCFTGCSWLHVRHDFPAFNGCCCSQSWHRYVLLDSNWVIEFHHHSTEIVLVSRNTTKISSLQLLGYPPASEVSRGVYWNQAQKNFPHPYTEYPRVSVSLCDSDSVANKPPIISAACHGIGPKFNFKWFWPKKFQHWPNFSCFPVTYFE